jgi:hypothetical protein
MKLPRRNFLHLAAGAATLPVISRIARAQAYPSRPVRCIVGYAPGGGTDIFVRLVGQTLPARLGQPFVSPFKAAAPHDAGRGTCVFPARCSFKKVATRSRARPRR